MMTLEFNSSRKRTALSMILRGLLARLTWRGGTCGIIYKGSRSQDLALKETRLRNQIEDSNMRLPAAKRCSTRSTVPVYLPIGWIQSLAVLSFVDSCEGRLPKVSYTGSTIEDKAIYEAAQDETSDVHFSLRSCAKTLRSTGCAQPATG